MKRVLTAAIMLAAMCPEIVFADDYPSKPIHVLTTSSAGGISDIFMRVLGEELHKSLNQPLIIDNRPGGAGNIAARACQDAQPDGYTICIINADLNAKTVDELIAVSKQKPGTLSYLTASVPMVADMDSLKNEKGADWVRVPFKGGGEATNAILGGSTPIGLIGLGNVISNIRAGKMTALALINNIRTPLLPDVPTLEDLGYKGAPSQTWYGLFAPPGTPRPIIDKIAAEVKRVFADKDFVEKYVISRGQVPAINTPDQFAAQIKADRAAAQEVVKASGMQPQ